MPEAPEAGAVTPVPAADTPAPVADAQKTDTGATDETAQQTEQETTEQQEAKKQSKFQRRLERQKTARIQAETRAQIAEERIRELEARTQQQPKDDAEPKREAFEDYEAYLRAVAKHDAKQETAAALKAEREARQGKEKSTADAARSDKLAREWSEREKDFEAANKDYQKVVGPYVEEELSGLSYQARQAIVESDVGPGLLFHLANHPEDAERIADLSPVRQIAELGKLETKLSAAPKKQTNAPAPTSPVSGGKTATKDISRMTTEEYRAHRKSQGARWAQ